MLGLVQQFYEDKLKARLRTRDIFVGGLASDLGLGSSGAKNKWMDRLCMYVCMYEWRDEWMDGEG